MKENSEINFNIVINYIPEDKVKQLKNKLENSGFKNIKNKIGMVMGCSRDCFDNDFYIGEILVTECYVMFKENMGYGMVIGDSVDRAFIMACIDAVEGLEVKEIKKLISDWFSSNLKFYDEYIKIEQNMFKSTKVNFGIMLEG